jgi:hypothetical protein
MADVLEAPRTSRLAVCTASAASEAAIIGWELSDAPGRQRRLRLSSVASALVSHCFPAFSRLLLILVLRILTLESCILILLRFPSDQCTSERARSVKIIRR